MNQFYPMNNQQYQPFQQQQQTFVPSSNNNSLLGRQVGSFNEITANDVPMNGGFALFPKSDLSEIQIRRWTPQGTIESQTYSIVPSAPKQPTELELLTDRVAKLEEALNKPTTKRGKNNESTNDTE